MKRAMMLTLLFSLFVLSSDGQYGPASQARPSNFVDLGSPRAGNFRYCPDCAATNPCTGGGEGAYAYRFGGGAWRCDDHAGGGGGSGTVTSVGNGTIGALFSTSWATATSTPTLSLNFASAAANCILSGPTSGGSAVPTCRAMVAVDVPTLDPTKIAGTAVITSDARLSDARAPAAHASTHAVAGSDSVTLTEAQVTNLTTDLAGKAPTGTYITSITGDGTAAGPGAVALTLASVVSASTKTKITYNAKGLVTAGADLVAGDLPTHTAALATALAANGTNCSAPNFGRGVDASGNCEGAAIVATDLPSTAVTPGSYTNTSLTIDQQGRITAASSGSAATPGGSPTQVQFNDASAFGGDAGLTYDKTTDALTVAGNIIGTGTANRVGTATTNDSSADTMLSASGTTKRVLVLQTKPSAAEAALVVQNSAGAIVMVAGPTFTGTTPGAAGDFRFGITGDGEGFRLTEKSTGNNRTIQFGITNTRAVLMSFGVAGVGWDDVSTTLKSTGCYGFVSNTTITSGTNDTCMWRDGAGGVQFAGGAAGTTKGYTKRIADTNGSAVAQTSGTELLTLSTSGTTTPTSGSIAAANEGINAILARVTTTITTATDWSVAVTTGISSCTSAWVAIGTTTTAQTALAAGTQVIFKPAAGLQCHVGTASTITVTTTGTPGAGTIRLTPVYEQFTAPTS